MSEDGGFGMIWLIRTSSQNQTSSVVASSCMAIRQPGFGLLDVRSSYISRVRKKGRRVAAVVIHSVLFEVGEHDARIDGRSGSLFSYIDLESRVRSDHPLRTIRLIVNDALAGLSAEFEGIYAPGIGRPSIPPERLLRALLLQAFYGIRSERQMVERLDHDLLFRWFVGLGVDDPVWDQTTFGKNSDRLLAGDVAHKFLAAVLAHPKVKRLLSGDHFSVDGTIIEAWASTKSVRPKNGSGEPPAPGRNGERDFHGERRTNDTHASKTDPGARLVRKGPGREAKLGFMGHA